MLKPSRQVRFLPRSIVDVPFGVLENIKWRPQAIRFLEKVGDTPEGKLYRADSIPIDDPSMTSWPRGGVRKRG